MRSMITPMPPAAGVDPRPDATAQRDALIPVTRPTLPDAGRYARYVQGIFDRAWMTNAGPLVQELTARLEDYLAVENLLLVANGTLALQVAFRALDLEKVAVTTPFSFAATTSSLLWEGITPRFCDVKRGSPNLDPALLPGLLTDEVSGIVPVHAYGIPCDVDGIARAARQTGARVVYDGAHAFGVDRLGRSILGWGDASTCSFHATKPFHTGEGGAIVFRERAALERARLMINFGLPAGDRRVTEIGINAKMSEFHAAVGLCILDDIDQIIERRLICAALYRRLLEDHVELLVPRGIQSNGGYMPILLQSRARRDSMREILRGSGVEGRPYFFPTLNHTFGFGSAEDTPNAKDLSERVLCLPLFDGLGLPDVKRIAELVCTHC
jgi:dTDP-4-amino-4,6-dideoxygalactose transaminase